MRMVCYVGMLDVFLFFYYSSSSYMSASMVLLPFPRSCSSASFHCLATSSQSEATSAKRRFVGAWGDIVTCLVWLSNIRTSRCACVRVCACVCV